jgi:hypothetical protein
MISLLCVDKSENTTVRKKEMMAVIFQYLNKLCHSVGLVQTVRANEETGSLFTHAHWLICEIQDVFFLVMSPEIILSI